MGSSNISLHAVSFSTIIHITILFSIDIRLLEFNGDQKLKNHHFRYILFYAPAKYMIDGREYNSLEDYVKYFNSTSSDGATLDESVPYYGGIKVPAKDYGSGSASIVLILFAFFVDSLAIAGIYIQYKGRKIFLMVILPKDFN